MIIYHHLSMILLQTEGQVSPEQFQSGTSLLWTFVQTIFALGIVCVLAYVVLKVILPRLNMVGSGRTMVRVVDRTPLDQRRSLMVVEVTGRWLLVGVSEAGLQLISELDPETAEREAEELQVLARSTKARLTITETAANARTAFADVFNRMINKR